MEEGPLFLTVFFVFCPSPAFHCRLAQYWLVGIKRCLVRVPFLFFVYIMCVLGWEDLFLFLFLLYYVCLEVDHWGRAVTQ